MTRRRKPPLSFTSWAIQMGDELYPKVFDARHEAELFRSGITGTQVVMVRCTKIRRQTTPPTKKKKAKGRA